jgi:uncharacterized protein (UPF0147 family)
MHGEHLAQERHVARNIRRAVERASRCAGAEQRYLR